MTSGLDVMQEAFARFTDTWSEHLFRFGEVFEDLKNVTDEKMKSKAIDREYAKMDAEYLDMQSNNDACLSGIFNAWGESGNPDALNVLAAMAEKRRSMKAAYDTMRQLRKDHFATNFESIIDSIDHWKKIDLQVEDAFKVAFDQARRADVRMGESLAKVYEKLYNSAGVGEAARGWWEKVVKMNDEITTKERKARAEFAKLPKEQRAEAKKKYYGETKQLQINELRKINEEGIAYLEDVIKGSKQGGNDAGGGTPPAPTEPSPVSGGAQVEGQKLQVEGEIASGVEQARPRNDMEAVQAIAEAEAKNKAQFKSNVDKFKEAQAQAEYCRISSN